ncbi:YigZ family protein [Mycoplasma sp. 21DD0573]|uniref:IMPACT family protein n=1 Tax=unclassified Mycoplasma TaxID=2683645 RepID=UPI002B1DEBBA|nr:YigZ family protein [Mycoplasma sp. 21DD0573]MEA4276592.1 YigZ family protein [Mycoplasma sp. 21DD0573]
MYKNELIIKKSEFIGYLYPVSSKEEVNQILKDLKAQYKDARHICYAYLLNSNGAETGGFSDDKEPSGTAGKPMFELIRLTKAQNVLVAVVRYFGGTKLGAGPLKKAYRQSASIVINLYLKDNQGKEK